MATWLAVGMQCDGCWEAMPAQVEHLKQGDAARSVFGVDYLCERCEAEKDNPDPPQNVGFV